MVSYTYDVWGRQIASTGDGSLAAKNPFRYRGYYYDAEIGWYYLESRYYDPEVGRFISADTADILDVSGNLYDKNLYAYCDNNPVVRKDITGEFWLEEGIVAAGAVIGGLMGAMSAASTGGNIKEAIIEGALTGAAGSAMGLSKYNPLIAGMIGAGIDIGVQLVS